MAGGQTRWMFTIDLPPAADGKRRQLNRKGFVSQQAALAAETEARKAYSRADLIADGSLAAELEKWLSERELDLQPSSPAATPPISLPARWWGRLQDITVGYGYRPVRAGVWLAALFTVGTVVFQWHQPRAADPGTAPDFVAPVYTLDLILPVGDFGQQPAYHPPRRDGLAGVRADRRRSDTRHHGRRGRSPPPAPHVCSWLHRDSATTHRDRACVDAIRALPAEAERR